MLIKQLYAIDDNTRALIETIDGHLYTFLLTPARKLTQSDLTEVGEKVGRSIYLLSAHAIAYDGALETMQMRAFGLTKSAIADARMSAGLTQQQLADKAGVGLRLIQKVEGGEAKAANLTARNLLAIADALGADPRRLI